MKTVIIGGGKGCQAVIDLAAGAFLRELTLEIQCVVDTDPNAPGMIRARELGVATCSEMTEALAIPGIELVIELTGQDKVLEKIYRMLPPGMRLVDHTFAHIFWDLVNAQQERDAQLQKTIELEQTIESDWHFLQSLFDAIPELVVVLDKNKQAMKINAGFARLSTCTPDEVIGKSCKELLVDTELSIYCQEMDMVVDEVLQSGQPRALIWSTKTPIESHWEVTFTPILGKDGDRVAVIATWHRITETVMLHRKIERAERLLRSFIDSARDWIAIKDLDGRYLVVNPVCAHFFNRQPEEFIGKTPKEVLPPGIAMTISRHDREVIESNRDQTYDEVVEQGGREHHYQTVRFPMIDHEGNAAGVCTIARDVTSERELQEQLVQAAKMAAVGRLAAGVAHEINNPLTGVLAYAEDMAEELPEDDLRRMDLQVIIGETIRCREIVRNLLDFARSETTLLKPACPNQIVDQSLRLIHKLPQFRNIRIRRELGAGIPQIMCDSQKIQQIILNLMLNASDAMNDQGEILLSTRFDHKHNKCIIEVEDSGPGIPAEMVHKIFEPFFSTKGTNGLGLAVSCSIIEQHDGTIDVTKGRRGGAAFQVVLPASTAACKP
jgi:PAS domain S-box-containing protein